MTGGGSATTRRRAAWVNLAGGNLALAVTVAQGLILVPLYLRFLGARLYGAWLGSGGVVGWLALLDVGIGSLMMQRMSSALGRDDRQEAVEYFTTGVLVQAGVAAAITAAAFGLGPFVPVWMGVPVAEVRSFGLCFLAAAVATALSVVNNGVSGLAFALQLPAFPTVASVLASVLGFAVTVVMLLQGFGLWAIAWGMLGRSGTLLAANLVHAVVLVRGQIAAHLTPSRVVMKDFLRLTPPMLAGSVASALGGRSEPTLIAILASPELAAVYSLTRRAADMAAMVLSRIGAAAFPGFAHLFASDERDRAAGVLGEVLAGYAAAATLIFGAFLAMDRSFVSLWVGKAQFGGFPLVALVGGAVFFSSRNGIVSYLYGATGEIARASVVIAIEAVTRVALMAVLLLTLGLVGLPLAALVTGVVMSFALALLMRQRLKANRDQLRLLWNPLPGVAHILVWATGLGVGAVVVVRSWTGLVTIGVVFAIVGLTLLLVLDARLRELGKDLLRWVWTPARGET